MEVFTPLIFIIVFGAAIFVDIFGHYRRGLYRKRFDTVFLAVLFVLLGISVIFAFASRNAVQPSDAPGQYVAFRYLQDNDPASALDIISEDGDMSTDHKSLLKILAEAEAGDSKDLFFDSSEYLDQKGHDAGLQNIVRELNTIAVNDLNGRKTSGSDISKLISNAYALSGIQETDDLQALYQADRNIRSGEAGSVNTTEIADLLETFDGYDVVQKIAISYYLTQEEYDSAAALSQILIEKKETEANYVLYTDVLAQAAYSQESETLAETDDKEIAPLVDNALEAYAAAMETGGDDVDAIERNLEKAEEYYDEARGVIYQRLINFLELKKQQGFDNDGYIALEIMKLRLLKKDYDKALDNMMALLNRIEVLDNSSPLRNDLIIIRDDLEKIDEDDARSGSPEFSALCSDSLVLLNNASCMIFTYGEDNINGNASKVIAAMLYDSLPRIETTGTDTSKYPKSEVYYSLNVQKKNIVGSPGEFYADDFTFTDMDVPVEDCKLAATDSYDGRSAVFVMDLQSGALSEDDQEEIKQGLYNLTDDDRIAEKFAFVNSSAYIQDELTNDCEAVRYAIRNLNAQYAVSAYSCLITALETMAGISSEEEGVIVYVTDGCTLSEEQLLDIVNRARSAGVKVFAYRIGSGEDGYTDSLCSSTGGISMHVPFTDQLCIFSGELSKLMNYRYTAMFTATAETDKISERVFSITLNAVGISDSITYAGGGS